MDKQEIKDAVIAGVQAGFNAREEDKKAFRIPAQPHWIQHEFLSGAMEFWADTRKIIWKAFLVATVGGVLGFIALGIAAFIYLKSRGFV